MSTLSRVASLAAIGAGGWLGYELFTQNGRLLLRVEALERQLAVLAAGRAGNDGRPGGLPMGSVAHDFALPSLSGDTMALSQWRGKRVLLIFFDPVCGYCQQMLPDLARLDPEPGDGRPTPLVVSTGGDDENRRLMEQHGVRLPVLLQEGGEVAELYRVSGTPMGYLVDAEGVTASELAVGARALLDLANARLQDEAGGGPEGRSGDGYSRGRFGSLAASRINRNGLASGTPAPGFRLPLVDGGELALEELRGRPVLLVFSDPDCGPCNALAPKLEQLHRRSPDLEVVMVSRGDPAANRAKVAEHGLTFPVVLQRRWEVSRDYGMFATPIGYLLDGEGVIRADVAVGGDAILALASAPR